MPTQWHPLFADLLRPLLEGYYDVQTNVPVGDVPREADLVLLRKTSARRPPFGGLWRHLKTWNILEYKGPSVSARLDDLDLLVELGLGIHRRLNEERTKARQQRLSPAEVSFWYIANDLGGRFRRGVEQTFGSIVPLEAGVWRCRAMSREVFLVSGSGVPVETDNLPLQVLARASPDKERAIGQLVVQNQSLFDRYGPSFAKFHAKLLTEVFAMARMVQKELKLKPLVDIVGLKNLIEEVGLKNLIEEVGLKNLIEEVGPKNVIDEVIDELRKPKTLRRLLDHLSAAEKAELKRYLEKESGE